MKQAGAVLLLFFVLYAAGGQLPAWSAEKKTVAVISGKAIAPYTEDLAGFKERLAHSGFDVAIRYFELGADTARNETMAQEMVGFKPDVIFTLGTKAVLFTKEHSTQLPIVFSMVLNPVESGVVNSLARPDHNLTGVVLDISPEAQFEVLRQMLPNARTVGIIYDGRKQEWLESLEKPASACGLTIVAQPVHSEADVPAALTTVMDKADCLWAQVDPLVYNAQSSQYILLNLIRRKIPLMAFSAQYVKAGALFAVQCDYAAIGAQSAGMAEKILRGQDVSSLAVASPEKTDLFVNKRIADLIGVEIPPKLLSEAREVYK